MADAEHDDSPVVGPRLAQALVREGALVGDIHFGDAVARGDAEDEFVVHRVDDASPLQRFANGAVEEPLYEGEFGEEQKRDEPPDDEGDGDDHEEGKK